MSVVSWPGPPCGVWLISSMFQYLLQMRSVARDQRPLLQLPKEIPDPQADQTHWGGEIHPADAEALGAIERRDHPEQIYAADAENEYRDAAQQFEIALEIAREQQRKGQRKVAEHQQ